MSCHCAGLALLFVLVLPGILLADDAANGIDQGALPEGAVARLGSTRWQTEAYARAVSFAPDGSFLACAGGGEYGPTQKLGYQVVTLFDGDTGHVLRRLRSPGDIITALCVSGSGKRIGLCKLDGMVCVLDAASGSTLWQVSLLADIDQFVVVKEGPEPSPGVRWKPDLFRLCFSHDDRCLFVTTTVRTVWGFNAETGSAVRRLHEPRAKMMALLPDGKTMVSARDDKTLGVWDLFSGEEEKRVALESIEADPFVYSDLRLFWPSPDRRFVLLGTQKRIIAVDLGNGKIIKTLAQASGTNALWKHTVTFSPNAAHMAMGVEYGNSSPVRIIDTRSLEATGELKILGPDFATMTFSADSERLGVATGRKFRWWNVNDGKEIPAEPAHRSPIMAVTFSPDGGMVATSGVDHSVRLWSTQTGKQLYYWPTGNRGYSASCLAFSPDGKLLAANLGQNTALIRCEDGQTLHQLPASGSPQKVSRSSWPCTLGFSEDGKNLGSVRSAQSPRTERCFQRWDIRTGELVQEVNLDEVDPIRVRYPEEGGYTSQAVSPDLGGAAASLFSGHTYVLWNAQTGEGLWRVDSQPGFANALFSPDSKSVVFGTRDGKLHFLSAETGAVLHQIAGPKGEVFPRAFLDGGRWLVAEHDDNTSRFWDVDTGQEIRRLQGHRIRALSKDERFAASVTEDYSVLIWDLTTFRDKVIDPREEIPLLPRDPADTVTTPLVAGTSAANESKDAQIRVLLGSAAPGKVVDSEAEVVRKAVAALRAIGARCDCDPEGKPIAVTFSDVFRYRVSVDEAMVHVGKLTDLKALNVIYGGITDAGMTHIKNLKNLESLHLPGAMFTDAALVNIEGLTKLRGISLSGTTITDDSLVHLVGLPELEAINLADTAITDAALKRLEGYKQLSYLVLRGTKITDTGLEQLKSHANLARLSLEGTRIAGHGLESLEGMTQLQVLSLAETDIDDVGLSRLGKLTSLGELYLNDTRITDADLKHLAGLTNLTKLVLDGTGIRGPGLEHLSPLTRLEELYLCRAPMTDKGVLYVKFLPNLQRLHVDDSATTSDGLDELQKILPGLRIYAKTIDAKAGEKPNMQ
ncbi:MAG TPA: PQQ-binding-like beta-propeller repeat protein [Thermoguttaceae bacterium]|nr:PQQ-binding-like beta-propeller repeat protein [Thermoguttaceae bacterium]